MRSLIGPTILAAVALLAILLAGQILQLGEILWSPGAGAVWPLALGLGAVAMLEVALLLVALAGPGIAYGRLAREGALIGRSALGERPLWRAAPAIALGVLLGVVAGFVAQGPGPRAVARLRDVVFEVVARGVVTGGRPLPGGGAIATTSGGEMWAAVPTGQSRAVALIRARDVRVEESPSAELRLGFRDAWIWTDGLRARVSEAHIRTDAGRIGRRLGALGPPNATPSDALDLGQAHHQFMWHRRHALPASAPAWALAGIVLGGALRGWIALMGGAGLVAGFYWALRAGELACRAGNWPAVAAAWLPVLAITVLAAAGFAMWGRRL